MTSDLSTTDTTQLYPLQSSWTLWYNGPKSAPEKHQWSKRFKKITTFENVQDFWRLFNNLAPPSVLPPGSDFHLFKGDIEPEWEHEANKGGGDWTYRMPIKDSNGIDQAWFRLVLHLIGNTFQHSEEYITGIVVSVRKSNARLAVWTSAANLADPTDHECIVQMGQQFKEVVEAKPKSLCFITHEDAKEGNKNNIIEL